MIFRADLHLHSCLSPCGGLDMSPSAIVQRARECGLNALALTDHNTARNSPAWQEVCRAYGLAHLFGIEVNTTEEAHILCYFDQLEAVMELDRLIYDSLPNVRNDPVRFGDQVIVNAEEEIEGEVEKYLHGAAAYSVGDLTVLVHELGGLVVPSHVDRDAFSLTSQLGFIPEDDFDALEVSRHYDLESDPLSLRGRYAMLTNSDAHTLDSIGTRFNTFELEAFTVEALYALLHREQQPEATDRSDQCERQKRETHRHP